MNDIVFETPVGSVPETDSELVLLEGIWEAERGGLEPVTQRRLAEDAGLSLGMTNAVLRRCVEKGWILIKRVNARKLHYAMTSAGINEIARRAYGYFRRASRSVSLYRDLIEGFVMERKRRGFARIVLAGPSDLDFLLEYACSRHGLLYARTGDLERAARMASAPDVCVVWGERLAAPPVADGEAVALRTVLLPDSVSV
ncbi:MAG: winged helix-turn-helix transcriptional regulator [Spirochaetales bacterium]|nr:winged helix-turn-helix transcriptional regulator [Spirochaetales bacterium]